MARPRSDDRRAAILSAATRVIASQGLGAAAIAGLPAESEPRAQLLHMWTQWLRWATTNPEKRRALAQLEVSDDVTADSHQTVRQGFGSIAQLLERSRANGPMKDAPLSFVLTLTTAIAEATIDAMIREPAEAEAHSSVAFDAMWRALAGTSLPAIA